MFIKVFKIISIFLIISVSIIICLSFVDTGKNTYLLEKIINWRVIENNFDGYDFKHRRKTIISTCYLQDYFKDNTAMVGYTSSREFDLFSIDGFSLSNAFFIVDGLYLHNQLDEIVVAMNPLDFIQNGIFANNFLIQNTRPNIMLLNMSVALKNWKGVIILASNYLRHFAGLDNIDSREKISSAGMALDTKEKLTALESINTNSWKIKLIENLEYLNKIMKHIKQNNIKVKIIWINGSQEEMQAFEQLAGVKYSLIKAMAQNVLNDYQINSVEVSSLTELDSVLQKTAK